MINPPTDRPANITPFGDFEGQTVQEITLRSPSGLEARVLTWGGVIRDLSLQLLNGQRQPLVLGFETFAPYPAHSPYFGAIVGRYANRIAHGRFALEGQTYPLDRNEAGTTTLHGGAKGFARRIWQIQSTTDASVTLALTSADGDQGFPGTVVATCTYTLTPDNALSVTFAAQTSKATPINLAQHAYFNLDGGPDLSNHTLQILADAYTPVDAHNIPTGEIRPVQGTPFDFRTPKPLGHGPQPFDHNFALRPLGQDVTPRLAAELRSLKSGVRMRVLTTKPGLQFYDGHKVSVPVAGLGGRIYGASAGLCLETQHFPDSPNQPAFPTSIIRPNQSYFHQTLYAFDQT